MLKIIESRSEGKCEEPGGMLDAIAREGARRMLAVAMEAEAASYVEAHRHERDEGGKALVVLSQLDGVAGRSFRNLPDVILAEPGHLTPYDVLWADQVVFTTHTVGSVGRASSYEVSEGDFVKEPEFVKEEEQGGEPG